MEVPRPAATVVVAREGDRGPEVLVLRRGAGHRFLPGFVAFPGGAVEPDDVAAARRWFGSDAHDDVARACAIRELAEEVGVAVTADGVAVLEGPLAAIDTAPPPREALPEISRWVAPEVERVRFDARFFAVAAAGAIEPRPDGRETTTAWWTTAGALLDGEPALYHPTASVLRALAGCADVAAILGSRIAQVDLPTGWRSGAGATS